MDPQIQDKINKIRESLQSGDVHPDALKQVESWEKELATLFDKEKYRENYITQILIKDARSQIEVINVKLLANNRLETVDRDALIAERKGYEWYLRLIDRDFNRDIKSIETDIDYELQ